MKFILFFAFVICVVAAFDFDLELITPATTKGKDEVFVSSTVETPAVVTTAPATTPTTTATTASTTTVRTTTEKEDEEQIRSKEGSTITSTFGTQNIPKVEVIVTRSIYRLMDEAFRQHLKSFEGRIAHLLNEKEKMNEVMDLFNPTFDDNFFEKAFDESNGIIEETTDW